MLNLNLTSVLVTCYSKLFVPKSPNFQNKLFYTSIFEKCTPAKKVFIPHIYTSPYLYMTLE